MRIELTNYSMNKQHELINSYSKKFNTDIIVEDNKIFLKLYRR